MQKSMNSDTKKLSTKVTDDKQADKYVTSYQALWLVIAARLVEILGASV